MTVKKEVIWNHMNYVSREHSVNSTGESMTIPGEAISIKELLDRATQGTPLLHREPIYFDQEDMEKIDLFYSPHIDLTDLDELASRNAEMHEMIIRAQKAETEAETEEVEVVEPEVIVDPPEPEPEE